MLSFDLSVSTKNIGAEYDDIQCMLNDVTCSSVGMGLLTPSARSPMSSFCSSKKFYSAEDLKNRIQQFCQSSGPIKGFYSLNNEKIMFEEALLVPTVLEAVESTFWISALSRLRGDSPSTFDKVILSFFVGLISLVCGAMFVAIVSCAVKIHRLVQTMKRARTLNENVQRLLAPQATNIRSAFAKLKGIVASKALDQVNQGYRKLRNKMITSFVANALITLAFFALLASAIISAFFFGGASGCLMAAFFGCLGVGVGSLAIGMLVGIVSAICQRKHKQEAARCIQRGAFYSLILEQMQRFPKEFLRDPVAKSIVALQAGDSLDAGDLFWEEMPCVTACLGREGTDAQAYSFISSSPLDMRI
jgi:hypothetical protein